MDEQEFQRLLCLFPVVRSRDYHAESESSSQSTSKSEGNELKEWQDAWSEGDKGEYNAQDHFWDKLRLAAEKKAGGKLEYNLDLLPLHKLLSRIRSTSQLNLLKKDFKMQKLINLYDIIKTVGVDESEKFCNAFRKVYQKLVYEGLSKEAKQQLLSSS